MAFSSYSSSCSLHLFLLGLFQLGTCLATLIPLGSKIVARDSQAWVSDNGTFAFGFTPLNSKNQFQLAIWYAELPGDRVTVWSANRNTPVGEDATLELDTTGNLVLRDQRIIIWASNTSNSGIASAGMAESGNLILYNRNLSSIWQSFSHPSDTLLPSQPLRVSLELTSTKEPSHGGYYTLKMLQEPNSLSLGLTYNSPNASSQTRNNYSYWSGPEVSNVTGDVVARLDENGNFAISYGAHLDAIVFVYKNDVENGGGTVTSKGGTDKLVLRRLILEPNGNLRLYRWDNDVNGSRQWVAEWAAVSNPCDISGICGNGICSLDGGKSKTNASCTCLPGSPQVSHDNTKCFANSSLKSNCKNLTSQFRIMTVPQTSYYYTELSVIVNYSDISTSSKCGDACLLDCDCVASVYGLKEEQAYCWVLRSLDFGGYEDPGSTLFVKVRNNGDESRKSNSDRNKTVVLPVVLCMFVLIGFLCFLLYYTLRRRHSLKKNIEGCLTVSGAPLNFSYRDLQSATNNFSQLIGTGGFGSVYKGTLGDDTLVAVKKLERFLPHGEKEFITEVNTIGSMHHVNLVRLCGFCSEKSQRLLVYEFMKNGSLDKWIFTSSYSSKEVQERLLDWQTRFHIAIATAQGIAYFHEQCRNRIIHCDIKPENILLDENFSPKVSDFGLAKLMAKEHSQVVTMVRGTRGYLAPEWISNRPITVKADVYSYGMLLLEIIGGRRNLDMSLDPTDFYYPGWAYKELTNGTPMKVVDKRLTGMVDEDEFVRAMEVALWCIQDEVWMRPSMGEVVRMLEGSVEINPPPMPQAVLELFDEGLDQVYKAMKREITHCNPSSRTTCSYSLNTLPSSLATYSSSIMSPR